MHRYLIFDATTSLGWDTGRAATNFVCIMLAGSAMLATFRRAARRAAFEAPALFEDGVSGEIESGASGAEVAHRIARSSSSDDGQ